MVYWGKCCAGNLLKHALMIIQVGIPCKWADDSQRFLLEHFDTICDSPSHIYHSALPLSPSSSWLHEHYGAESLQEVKVVRGLPAGWGTCSRTVSLGTGILSLSCWNKTIAIGTVHRGIIILDEVTGSQTAVLSGHTDEVNSVVFTSDGKSLVSGSDDKTVKLWDMQTGGVVRTFSGHTKLVRRVSVSADCATIASGSWDYTTRLWNVHTGECHCIIDQSHSVKCVHFSPADPQHLISISGGIVQQWDTNGHQIKLAYGGFYAAFSLDGTHLVLWNKGVTTVQNSDSGAIVTKCPTGRSSRYCCFSPNGRLVAVAAGATASVWDITSSDPHLIETFIGHKNAIVSLTFSSSSSLISVSDDLSIKFWQIGASPTDSVASDPKSIPSTSTSIMSVGLQADNGIAISSDSDGRVKTWDLSTGLCKASFQTPVTGGVFRDARITDSGLVVACLGAGGIHIWDTKKGGLPQVIKTTESRVKDLKISRDGSKVFLLSMRSIQAWSMHTGEAVGEVVLENGTYIDLLHTSGSRISVHFPNALSQGWDFGISGSSPVPLPNMYLERPHLDLIGGACSWYQGPNWIKNTVTGKEVFQLSGRYARPYEVEWDGRYLVAGYESGVLFQTFSVQLPTFSSFYFPLSPHKSLKTITKQQQTLMIVSFNEPTTTTGTRLQQGNYSMGSSLASI
jgi:WD40 repeat protein